MESWSRLIGDPPVALALFPDLSFRAFPYYIFVPMALFYSTFVLGITITDAEKASPIFSPRNAQPLAIILLIHTGFLAAIFGLVGWISYRTNTLPDWFSRRGGSASGAFIELSFLACLFALRMIERRWVYVQPPGELAVADTRFTEPEAVKDE
jgi:hypothetical protein